MLLFGGSDSASRFANTEQLVTISIFSPNKHLIIHNVAIINVLPSPVDTCANKCFSFINANITTNFCVARRQKSRFSFIARLTISSK